LTQRCFDADDEADWLALQKLASRLAVQQITGYLENSQRGGHLWLFLEPTSGKTARRFGKQLIKDRGLDEIEIYPR